MIQQPILRDYQNEQIQQLYAAWNAGHKNVLNVMPTGGGKTVTFSQVLSQWNGYTCSIAHRRELVSQISMSYASFGLYHRLIAPDNVIKALINEQRREFGRTFYNPQAPAAIAGVDTLVSRAESLKSWLPQVTLWNCDEAHHDLKINKWGKATALFTNALGMGWTATPQRADGKGLGAHSDGVFHAMVIGPSMRDLINIGSLTEYEIACPPSDFNIDNLGTVGTSGDYSQKKMAKESKRSHITGDIIRDYLRFARGKQGICFVTDVDTAHHVANKFRAAGIRAESVSAKTPEAVRNEFIRRFRNGDIDILVNVDLFGEGFDVPAVEVVIMARPTQSLAVYLQQFGRVLRPMDGKQAGLVIDHVGNVVRHLYPDMPRNWSLDAREKRSSSKFDPDLMPLTSCLNCYKPYERTKPRCPYCGHYHVPEGRVGIEQVDGDLELLSIDMLNKMRQAVAVIDAPAELVGNRVRHAAGDFAAKGAMNRHFEKQQAQAELRATIAQWAGLQRSLGREDRESYRRFYLSYGIDVLSAKALGRKDADALRERIQIC